MELTIGKWGNSLAVRLPAELVRRMGLGEGDNVRAEMTDSGELHLHPAHVPQDDPSRAAARAQLVADLERLHATMPMTSPVSRDELSRY